MPNVTLKQQGQKRITLDLDRFFAWNIDKLLQMFILKMSIFYELAQYQLNLNLPSIKNKQLIINLYKRIKFFV